MITHYEYSALLHLPLAVHPGKADYSGGKSSLSLIELEFENRVMPRLKTALLLKLNAGLRSQSKPITQLTTLISYQNMSM